MPYENNISFGWIKIYRSVQDHWLWNNGTAFDERSAWIDLLLMMNFKERKFQLGKELLTAERGERVTSERKLAERWGWSRTKTRNYLELLEKDGMIELEKTSKRTRVKACNYDLYQGWNTDEKTTREPAGDQKETTGGPGEDTNNNVNNSNKGNKENTLSGCGGGKPAGISDLIYYKYMDLIGETLTEAHYNVINGYLDSGFSEETIVAAFKEANFNGVKSFAYIRGILNRWYSEGITTLEDVREDINKHEAENITKNKNRKGNANDKRFHGYNNREEAGKRQESSEYERFFKE